MASNTRKMNRQVSHWNFHALIFTFNLHINILRDHLLFIFISWSQLWQECGARFWRVFFFFRKIKRRSLLGTSTSRPARLQLFSVSSSLPTDADSADELSGPVSKIDIISGSLSDDVPFFLSSVAVDLSCRQRSLMWRGVPLISTVWRPITQFTRLLLN